MSNEIDPASDNLKALWEFLDSSARQWHRLFPEEEEGPVDISADATWRFAHSGEGFK